MAKIIIEIDCCMDCPFVRKEKMYTADSWEDPYNYYCGKTAEVSGAGFKKIAGYIEWRREMPDVPDWCPCRADK